MSERLHQFKEDQHIVRDSYSKAVVSKKNCDKYLYRLSNKRAFKLKENLENRIKYLEEKINLLLNNEHINC